LRLVGFGLLLGAENVNHDDDDKEHDYRQDGPAEPVSGFLIFFFLEQCCCHDNSEACAKGAFEDAGKNFDFWPENRQPRCLDPAE
jgi:hypothetical protein